MPSRLAGHAVKACMPSRLAPHARSHTLLGPLDVSVVVMIKMLRHPFDCHDQNAAAPLRLS